MFSLFESKKVVEKSSPLALTGSSQLFRGIVRVLAGMLSGGEMSACSAGDSLVFVWIVLASAISYCLWYVVVGKANLSNLYIIKFSDFAIFRIQYFVSFLLISAGIFISNKK